MALENTMGIHRNYTWPISIVIAAAILTLGLWQLSDRNRFTITTAFNDMNIPFLCDNQTGKIWRYYRTEDRGVLTSEGFTLIFDPTREQ